MPPLGGVGPAFPTPDKLIAAGVFGNDPDGLPSDRLLMRKKQLARRARRRIEVRYGPEETKYIGYSRNVSRTGMMVAAVRIFEPGTLLSLVIKLPAGTFQLKGTVIWAREGSFQWLTTGRIGMGISFVDPPQGFLDTIGAGGATA